MVSIASKNARALELLAALRYGGWNNPEFWEANQILRSVSSADMTDVMIRLLTAWTDIECDRIACGEHDPCSPELDAVITAQWPVVT